MKKIITEIEQKMLGILDNAQMEHLHKVLVYYLESEDILVQEEVSNVKIYNNNFGKSKIDFDWTGARYRINGISMTDQDFYDKIRDGRVVNIEKAYIITAIPKYAEWEGSDGISKAYKFVSRIFPIEKEYDRIFNVKVVGGLLGS